MGSSEGERDVGSEGWRDGRGVKYVGSEDMCFVGHVLGSMLGLLVNIAAGSSMGRSEGERVGCDRLRDGCGIESSVRIYVVDFVSSKDGRLVGIRWGDPNRWQVKVLVSIRKLSVLRCASFH